MVFSTEASLIHTFGREAVEEARRKFDNRRIYFQPVQDVDQVLGPRVHERESLPTTLDDVDALHYLDILTDSKGLPIERPRDAN